MNDKERRNEEGKMRGFPIHRSDLHCTQPHGRVAKYLCMRPLSRRSRQYLEQVLLIASVIFLPHLGREIGDRPTMHRGRKGLKAASVIRYSCFLGR